MSEDLREQVVADLKASRKNRELCDDTLSRIADWAADRHPTRKAATKAAKRKLHQIYGAYVGQLDPARIEALISSARPDSLVATCQEIMASHASTAERLPLLDGLYPAIFDITGVPETILDLACGLHPFALPWMGLPSNARYVASDIDQRLIRAINALTLCVDIDLVAECRDVLVDPPTDAVDLVFLLKSAPCLEQQRPNAVVDILRRMPARHGVVSFPNQSLGGRDKGMRQHYAAAMEAIAEQLCSGTTKLEFPSETFHIIKLI